MKNLCLTSLSRWASKQQDPSMFQMGLNEEISTDGEYTPSCDQGGPLSFGRKSPKQVPVWQRAPPWWLRRSHSRYLVMQSVQNAEWDTENASHRGDNTQVLFFRRLLFNRKPCFYKWKKGTISWHVGHSNTQ